MCNKIFVVKLKVGAGGIFCVSAHHSEIHEDHLVLSKSTGELAGLFQMQAVESWIELPKARVCHTPERKFMGYRILSVGKDINLLKTRHELLTSRGYDSLIATPEDIDQKLHSGMFDLVILSAMLSSEAAIRASEASSPDPGPGAENAGLAG